MGLRSSRCIRALCAAAAAICLGSALSLGAALAQDGQNPGRKPTGLVVDAPIRFQTWRKITLGTRKGVNDYRNALDAAGIKIGDSADEILGRPAFRYAGMKTEIELTLISAATLGVHSETALAEVYKRARQAGLELCPPEVGPQLRLDYRNQPLGEALNVAMEPVATYGGQPTILSLVNFGSGLALIGGDGRSDFLVPRTFLYVFALPPTERLEAARDPRNAPPN